MKKTIKQSFIFLFFSFVILTFCSENSFLYPFNTEPDVSCFYLLGKSILHGKTLYKDIYEQKGLYLYLIYMLAYLIDANSYIGVYIMEILSLTVFMLFAYKTINVLSHKEKLSAAIAILSGVLVCVNDSFQEGGYAEEFFLPFLMIVIFLAVHYYAEIYPKRIPAGYVISIGALSGFIFWAKYTSLGLVIGLGIFVTIQTLGEKRFKDFFRYFAELLLGFIMITLPVIGYFYYNNAIKELFTAYFYNLLVLYSDSTKNNSGISNFAKIMLWGDGLLYLFAKSAVLVFVSLCINIVTPKRVDKKVIQVNQAMFWASLLLTAYGIIYNNCYQVIVLFVFFPIGLYFAYLVLSEIQYKELGEKLNLYLQLFWKHKKEVFFVIGCFGCISYGLFRYYNPIYWIVVMGYLLILLYFLPLLENALKRKASEKFTLFVKYLFIAAAFILYGYMYVWYSENAHVYADNLIFPALIIATIVFLMDDLLKGKLRFLQTFIQGIGKQINTTSKFYGVILVCTCVLIMKYANNLPYMFWDKADTPMYVFAEYIKEQGIEDPIIVSLDLSDVGLYNILGIDPQIKYTGWYNNRFPEIEDYRRSLFESADADYIVSTHFQEEYILYYKNYHVALRAEEYSGSGSAYYYILLERNKTNEE